MTKNLSQNVTRATRILLALGASGPRGMALSDLGDALGDPKPAVHRALQSMLETGFVTQAGRRGRYMLGPSIYALANRTPSVPDLVARMRPSLLSITGETGYSAFLMMRAGSDSVCIDLQPGRILAPALIEGIGGRVPLGLGMAGVVLLGQLDTPSRDRVIAANAAVLAAHGVTPDQIREEIAAYFLHGYAAGLRSGQGFANLTIAFPVDAGLPGCDAAVSVLIPESLRDAAARAALSDRIRRILDEQGGRSRLSDL